jgi:predicted patatin/cPLA2 family phospholipase
VDIDYLIDFVLKKNNPLDIKKVVESKIYIYIYIPLTNSATGEVEYFSNKSGADIWGVLKAAVSVPFCTNLFYVMGNRVNGKLYSDSSPASRFQIHVQKALNEGAECIIVFDNWHPDDNPNGYFLSKLYTFMRNNIFRKNQMNYFREMENFSAPKNVNFLKIIPSAKLAMSRYEIDNTNARKVFQRGYEETLSNDKLKKLYESGRN